MKRYLHLFCYAVLSIAPLVIYLNSSLNINKIMNTSTVHAMNYFIYGGLALCAYLGFRVNQLRIFFTSIALLLIFKFEGVSFLNKLTGLNDYKLLQVILLAYPVYLIINFIFKESSLLSLKTFFKLALSIIPLVFLAYPETRKISFDQIINFKYITPFDSYILAGLSWISFNFFSKEEKIKDYLIAATIGLIVLYSWGWIEMVNPGRLSKSKDLYKVLSFGIITALNLHSIILMYWRRVYLDELTSLSNRRALNEAIEVLSNKYTIAMIDVDHFKKFNDKYGHDQGDDVLKLVAKTLHSILGDRVYRYGGEEFAAVFDGQLTGDTIDLMDEVREKLASIKFHVRGKTTNKRSKTNRGKGGGRKVGVTISIGVSNVSKKADTPEKVIKMADNALYKAKKKGRNCVVAA